MTRSEFNVMMKKHGLVVGEAAWTVAKIVADELKNEYLMLAERHAADACDDYGQRHLLGLANDIRSKE